MFEHYESTEEVYVVQKANKYQLPITYLEALCLKQVHKEVAIQDISAQRLEK